LVQAYGSLGRSFHTTIEKGLEAEYLVQAYDSLIGAVIQQKKRLEAEYLVQVYGSLGWSCHITIEKG
jgi:hypothetical protein